MGQVKRKRFLCHMRTTKVQISTFVVCCLDSMICILTISKVSRFWLTSVAEQVGLNLTFLKIPEDTFWHDEAQMTVDDAHATVDKLHVGRQSLPTAKVVLVQLVLTKVAWILWNWGSSCSTSECHLEDQHHCLELSRGLLGPCMAGSPYAINKINWPICQ